MSIAIGIVFELDYPQLNLAFIDTYKINVVSILLKMI